MLTIAPAPDAAEQRQARAHAEERTQHVDALYALERVGRGRVDRREVEHRGVVHQDVETALGRADVVDDLLPGLLVGDVEMDETGRSSEVGRGRGAPLVEDVGQHDPCPLFDQAAGGRGTGPPGGAGDECDLGVQSMHPRSLQHHPPPEPRRDSPRSFTLMRGDRTRRYKSMELRPTPESWRIALATAFGALGIAVCGLALALGLGGRAAVAAGIAITIAALATFVPALGALSAVVDADGKGVTVRRLGRSARIAWSDVTDVRVVDRPASVPDGTEYHWVVPRRPRHVVAVPVLLLADGRVRQLPALAAPADGSQRAVALAHLRVLTNLRLAASALATGSIATQTG